MAERRRGEAWAWPRPSPAEWLLLAGSLFLTLRYFWLLDDAFVYFRYVDNWLFLKAGLVYNRGEYVEGFSSPLWLILLAALRATGLSFWHIVLGLSVVFCVLFWYLVVAVNRRLSGMGPTINLPLAYLGLNYAVTSYFSSGMETPLVQLAAPLFALYLLVPPNLALEAGLALAPLVRHELALPLVIILAWDGVARKRIPWRPLAMAAAFALAWTSFRVIYYADLLPNTFYLKHESAPWQGLIYLWQTLFAYRFPEMAAVMFALALALRRKRSLPEPGARLMMLLLAASVAAYVVRIGGDPRHYRYLAFSFCLAAMASGGLPERAMEAWLPRLPRRILPWLAIPLALAAASLYPPQLDRHPLRPGVRHVRTDGINDAAMHRWKTWPMYSSWGRDTGRVIVSRRGREGFEPRYDKVLVNYRCKDHYRGFDKRVINSLGLTDAVLARTVMGFLQAAHKMGLVPMAGDIAALQERYGWPRRGIYRQAVADGRAPPWVSRNLDSLEVIERKIYNRHAPIENLKLALTFPHKIVP